VVEFAALRHHGEYLMSNRRKCLEHALHNAGHAAELFDKERLASHSERVQDHYQRIEELIEDFDESNREQVPYEVRWNRIETERLKQEHQLLEAEKARLETQIHKLQQLITRIHLEGAKKN
jgi:hypothetical protein